MIASVCYRFVVAVTVTFAGQFSHLLHKLTEKGPNRIIC